MRTLTMRFFTFFRLESIIPGSSRKEKRCFTNSSQRSDVVKTGTEHFILRFISGAIMLCGLCVPVRAYDAGESGSGPNGANISFIENRGQWEDIVRYKAEVPGGAMFLTDQGFAYTYIDQEDLASIHDQQMQNFRFDDMKKVIDHHAYFVHFVHSKKNIQYEEYEQRTTYHNYFLGNDASKWAGGVRLYGKIKQQQVYEGIDVVLYSEGLSLKYEFFVEAGQDPSQIILEFEGVQPMLTQHGDLLIKTTVNEIIEEAPYSYQIVGGQELEVASQYKLEGNRLSFEFPNGYDTAYPLVVDPTLIFATYSGGTSGPYFAHSTTYGRNGTMYAAALGVSSNWPTTPGAFQRTGLGNDHTNVCINKYDSAGAVLIYSTYYSGNTYTVPNVMRENPKGELVLAGATGASNLPFTTGAFDSTHNGESDIYVAHFNASGTDLIGATFVGGSGGEPGLLDIHNFSANPLTNAPASTSPIEIAFDSAGNIWISSNTSSVDFPVTDDATQSTLAGGFDGVLFQLDPTCSRLMYSTYMGGSADDGIFMLKFADNEKLAFVGGTKSTDFPTTSGVLHPTAPGGGDDGFVSIFNIKTKALEASSYLGTTAQDNTTKLQIDRNGAMYVLGRTNGDYPISLGVWATPNTDVYIDILTPDLSASVLSTRIGRSQSSSLSGGFVPSAFLLDSCGKVYVAGFNYLAYAGMPLTPDAFETAPRRFWFCVLSYHFSDLYFSSYFGASGSDHMHAGASHFSRQGVVYHSICSADPSFSTTPGSFSPNKLGVLNDMLSFKLAFEPTGVKASIALPASQNDTICASGVVQFENNSTSPFPMTFVWDFGDGRVSEEINPIHTFRDTGVYDVVLHVHSSSACVTDSWDTLTITVIESPPKPDIWASSPIICRTGQVVDVEVFINNPSMYNSITWGPEAAIIGRNDTTLVTINSSASNAIYVIVKDSLPNICGVSITDTIYMNKAFLDFLPVVNMRPECRDRVNGSAWINIHEEDTLDYNVTWRSNSDSSVLASGDSLLNIPTGNYNVHIVAANGCDTTLYFFLPYEEYYADFVTSDTIGCVGDFISFDNQSDDHFDSFFWTFGDQSTSTELDPEHSYNSAGRYKVMLAGQGPVCNDTVYKTVIIDEPPKEGFVIEPSEVCLGEPFLLRPMVLSDTTITRIGWQLGNDNFRWEADLNPSYQHAFDQAGKYYIKLVRQFRACADLTWMDSIVVYALPVVDLGPDSTICLGGSPILLKNRQEQPGGMVYSQWWNTGDSTETISVMHAGIYTLTVSSKPLGCSTNETIIIDKDCYVNIPNAFTPNNDGNNDYFFPRELLTDGVSSFRMQVFNRWGQSVFETTNLDGRGWNGKFNGQEQPIGVYIYIIDVLFNNSRQEQYTGNITILR